MPTEERDDGNPERDELLVHDRAFHLWVALSYLRRMIAPTTFTVSVTPETAVLTGIIRVRHEIGGTRARDRSPEQPSHLRGRW